MKKLIFILLILVSANTLCFAQTWQVRPLWEIDNRFKNPELQDTLWINEQKRFFIGGHWLAASKHVLRMLNTTFYHNHDFRWDDSLNNSPLFERVYNDTVIKNMIVQAQGGFSDPAIMNNYLIGRSYLMGIRFDPELPLRPEMPGPSNLRSNGLLLQTSLTDTTGAAFGFSWRNSARTQVTGHKLKIISNTVAGKDTVIKDPSNPSELMRYPIKYHVSDELNGSRMYFSVNLRRTNDYGRAAFGNDTLLVITLPYKVKGVNYPKPPLIYFDSIPAAGYQAQALPHGRGLYQPLQQADTNSTALIITRNMLPPIDSAEKDITISAYFRLKFEPGDKDTTKKNNSFVLFDRNPKYKDGEITKLGITVQAYPHADLEIDWFSMNTPQVQKLLTSQLDTSVVRAYFQNEINNFVKARSLSNKPNTRLMALYGDDEPWLSTIYAQRHYAQLLGGRWLSYTMGQNPYCGIVKPRYRWQAEVPTVSRTLWGSACYNPYFFKKYLDTGIHVIYDSTKHDTVNFASRIIERGSWGPNWFKAEKFDTLFASHYEMRLDTKPIMEYLAPGAATGAFWITEYSDDLYATPDHHRNFLYPQWLNKTTANEGGSQLAYEGWSAHNYIEDSAIYLSRQPWWSNIWLGSNWVAGNMPRNLKNSGRLYDTTLFAECNQTLRPLTGEEARQEIWGALIHGCKGLMFERFHNDPMPMDPAVLKDTILKGEGAFLGVCSTPQPDSVLAMYGERIFDTPGLGIGDDFITQNDPSTLDKFINRAVSAKQHGVDTNRIYIGRLSTRYVVKTITDQLGGAYGIGDTLMHLHLKAWYGKGYGISAIGDTSLLKKYINVSASKGITRPPGRTHLVNGIPEPHYERSDSSLYDITLLEYDSLSTDAVFYLGTLNKRCAPFVWLAPNHPLAQNRPDTLHHPSKGDSVLTFLTTIEFNKYAQLPDTAPHHLHRYAQTGSREISIPFQYKDSSGKYALFRIRELRGKDTAIISKAPPIDTVIGQDGRLTALYQPGEGRIFRVEKLSTTDFKGELAFSNQNKICSYPLMRKDLNNKWIESDSLCYYATYHKIIDSTIDRWGVYFRMSYPGKKQAGSQIKWHNREYLLSDSIHYLNYGITKNDTCAYPSIVVRFNPDSQAYHAFIVYGCLSQLRSPLNSVQALNEAKRQYIVESIVNIVQDSVVLPAYAIALDSVMDMQRRLNVYGTPMISAADSANFYTYSDINRGIVACWKYPSTNPGIRNYFRDSIYFSFKGNAKPYGALHPSLNSYSRGFNGAREQSSSLVWQEALDSLSVYQIYYTRLWTDDSAHIHFGLGQIEDTSSTMPPLLLNANKTIACLSSSRLPFIECRSHTMPVVYRELYIPPYSVCDYNDTIPTLGRLRLENIAWQTWQCNTGLWNYIPIPYSSISRRFVFSSDTAVQGRLHPASLPYSPGVNTIDPVLPILGIAENYDQPVLQGGNASNVSTYCFNTSWRGLALQFRRSQSWLYKLQHLEMPPIAPAPPVNAIVELSDWGNLGNGHLSAHPNLKVDDWFILRRLYEKKQGSPLTGINYIRNSLEKFARTIEERTRHFCGYGDEYSDMTFEGIAIGDQYYPIGEPVAESTWQLALPKAPPDTLFTDWFRLDTGRIEAILYSSGITSNHTWCYLERRWDGLLYPIEYVEGAGITESALYFENGNNEEYRLKVWPRNKENSIYRDRTFITTSLASGLSKRSESTGRKKEYGLSLHNSDQSGILTVYPNPAEEYIIIRAGHSNGLSEPYQIELSDAMGRRQIIGQIQSGMSVQYPTTTLSSGLYTVRLLQPAQKTIPIVQVMIIK